MSSEGKIVIEFTATGGNTPEIKGQNKFKLPRSAGFHKVFVFLRKLLAKNAQGDTNTSGIFLFVNNTFQPRPDENVGDLFDCFSSGKVLVVNYSTALIYG